MTRNSAPSSSGKGQPLPTAPWNYSLQRLTPSLLLVVSVWSWNIILIGSSSAFQLLPLTHPPTTDLQNPYSYSPLAMSRTGPKEEVVSLANRRQTHSNDSLSFRKQSQSAVSTESRRTALSKSVKFISPLVDAGYPPAVLEQQQQQQQMQKPLLIYLPGFDGTLLAPFLQFPELSTEFDVRGMTVDMNDRSSFLELKNITLDYIRNVLSEVQIRDRKEERSIFLDQTVPEQSMEEDSINNLDPFATICQSLPQSLSEKRVAKSRKDFSTKRPLYLVGESFGGILALEVAIALSSQSDDTVNLQGIVLVNPATSYDRSKLAFSSKRVISLPPLLYPFALLWQLVPLFLDDYGLPQLLLILQAKALPSVIDTPAREAYLGRTSFSIPKILKYMSQNTLSWRLEEWLSKGCATFASRTEAEWENGLLGHVRVLIVVGENDKALPSVEEADRLSGILKRAQKGDRVRVHVVQGAGHACTCGSRVDLTALMRSHFPQLLSHDENKNENQLQQQSKEKETNRRRTAMKEEAARGNGKYFGMERRYDNSSIGLSPLMYWSDKLYLKKREI